MGELVKRLRAAIVYVDCDDCMGDQLKTEAADRIEALEAENARLRRAMSYASGHWRGDHFAGVNTIDAEEIDEAFRAAQEDKA